MTIKKCSRMRFPQALCADLLPPAVAVCRRFGTIGATSPAVNSQGCGISHSNESKDAEYDIGNLPEPVSRNSFIMEQGLFEG